MVSMRETRLPSVLSLEVPLSPWLRSVSWANLAARAWIRSGRRDNDDAGSLAGVKDLAGRTCHGVCSHGWGYDGQTSRSGKVEGKSQSLQQV